MDETPGEAAAAGGAVPPLHAAVLAGDVEEAARLLEAGGVIEERDSDALVLKTLHLPEEQGDRLLPLLLGRGARPKWLDKSNHAKTPLQVALASKHMRQARALLEAGVDLDESNGQSALADAVDAGPDTVRFVLKHARPDKVGRHAVAEAMILSFSRNSAVAAVVARLMLGALSPDDARAAAQIVFNRVNVRALDRPGLLAALLAAGAEPIHSFFFTLDSFEQEVEGLSRRDDPDLAAASVLQLLRAGVAVDTQTVSTIARLIKGVTPAAYRDYKAAVDRVATALIEAGSDPERHEPGAEGAVQVTIRRLPNMVPFFLRALGPRIEAVREATLSGTGDRDSTRLVLAFFSTLTPLDVPLGQLADANPAKPAAVPGRAVVRARRRRRK